MTEKDITIIPATKTGTAERVEGSDVPALPRLGEWYWLRVQGKEHAEFRDAFVREKHGKYTGRLLTCITAIGSNFIEVSMQRPGRDHSSSWRVHLDTMDDLLVPAPEALDYIASRVAAHRSRATHLLAEIHELTRRLGVGMGDAALPAGGELLCIDSYQPGSYKQFFADPRTRADYLRWAPLLLTAENYVYGKAQVSEPPVGEARGRTKKMSRL